MAESPQEPQPRRCPAAFHSCRDTAPTTSSCPCRLLPPVSLTRRHRCSAAAKREHADLRCGLPVSRSRDSPSWHALAPVAPKVVKARIRWSAAGRSLRPCEGVGVVLDRVVPGFAAGTVNPDPVLQGRSSLRCRSPQVSRDRCRRGAVRGVVYQRRIHRAGQPSRRDGRGRNRRTEAAGEQWRVPRAGLR